MTSTFHSSTSDSMDNVNKVYLFKMQFKLQSDFHVQRKVSTMLHDLHNLLIYFNVMLSTSVHDTWIAKHQHFSWHINVWCCYTARILQFGRCRFSGPTSAVAVVYSVLGSRSGCYLHKTNNYCDSTPPRYGEQLTVNKTTQNNQNSGVEQPLKAP